jgi:protein TonB
MAQNVSLADFARASGIGSAEAPSTRWKAGGLTLLLYAGLALLALLPSPAPPEETVKISFASLLPDHPRAKTDRPPAPYLAPLIKPRPVSLSPPDFAVAPATPPAPAPLAATATPISPLSGGTTDGDSASAGSANGVSGNGNDAAGCFDAAWGRAVHDRVAKFYFIPSSAKHASGVVMVHFIVRRSGRLNRSEVSKSSGNEWLDRAALAMVRNAVPLPPLPERMHAARADVEMPIGFNAQRDDHPTPTTCR